MVKTSTDLGGNAIIGISYGFMTFIKNMIGVSVSGTSVKIEKIAHPDNAGGIYDNREQGNSIT